MVLDKTQLPQTIANARTLGRRTQADDLPKMEAWPPYPWPYEVFSMAPPSAASSDGAAWWRRIADPDRCHYSVVLRDTDEIIGLHAFVQIDWKRRSVGNMGVRIHPDLCGKGYGTESLSPLLAAVLDSGIRTIRLDVAATNKRPIRCYEKCGMTIVGEFWREHSGEAIDPADPKWTPLMPDVRRDGDRWMVRFYWMEIQAGLSRTIGL